MDLRETVQVFGIANVLHALASMCEEFAKQTSDKDWRAAWNERAGGLKEIAQSIEED